MGEKLKNAGTASTHQMDAVNAPIKEQVKNPQRNVEESVPQIAVIDTINIRDSNALSFISLAADKKTLCVVPNGSTQVAFNLRGKPLLDFQSFFGKITKEEYKSSTGDMFTDFGKRAVYLYERIGELDKLSQIRELTKNEKERLHKYTTYFEDYISLYTSWFLDFRNTLRQRGGMICMEYHALPID